MKKLLSGILFLTVVPFLGNASCTRPDRGHENRQITRCPYLQENIYKAFAEKPGAYGDLEKYKKCFFCECPISEHTSEPKSEVKKVLKKKERQVNANTLTHG